MVNIEFAQPALWLGMGFIGGGLALYQLRRLTPEISRDADVLISSVAVFSGGILIFQGWRLDPLLLFCQLLTAGTMVVWAVEAINLRKMIDSEQRFDNRTRQYPPMEVPQVRDRGIPLPPPREDDFGRWYDQDVDRPYDVPAESSGQGAGYFDEGGYYRSGIGGYEQEGDPYAARSQEAYYDDDAYSNEQDPGTSRDGASYNGRRGMSQRGSYSGQQDPGTSRDSSPYDDRRGSSQRDVYPAGSRRRIGRDSEGGERRYSGGERWSSGIEVGSQDDWD